MVADLNMRFLHGTPSNQLSQAGVLVRQVDALTTYDGSAGPWDVSGNANFADRLSASVVNAAAPFMFSTSAVGFILRSSSLPSDALWCSYPHDGNSMAEALSGARHGCGGNDYYGKPLAFMGSTSLKAMMEQQLSEMHPRYAFIRPSIILGHNDSVWYSSQNVHS